MADFAPPPVSPPPNPTSNSKLTPQGPPPPKVPEGWKAVWNDQYHEWFFVNIYTKQSTWEKPTSAVYPSGEAPPGGAPPAYIGGAASHPTGASEKSSFSSNNPYGSQQPGISSDEKLARKLQEEEQARAGHGDRGASNDYYGASQSQSGYGGAPQSGYPQPGGYSQQQQYQSPATPSYADDKSQSKGKGLLGKLLGKSSHSSSSHQPAYGGGGGYYPQQQGMYQQQPGYAMPAGRRPGGGGMGMGGMAMGAGAGMLGGVLLGEALGDAGDGGGDGGGDYGGGDGGGDYGGGDMGGGDMGGGDF